MVDNALYDATMDALLEANPFDADDETMDALLEEVITDLNNSESSSIRSLRGSTGVLK